MDGLERLAESIDALAVSKAAWSEVDALGRRLDALERRIVQLEHRELTSTATEENLIERIRRIENALVAQQRTAPGRQLSLLAYRLVGL